MITHAWTVLCKSSSVDETSRNMTLNEAIERLQFVLPLGAEKTKDFVVPVKFEVVSLWIEPEPSDTSVARVRSFFKDPLGHEIMHTEYALALTSQAQNRLRHSGRISQFFVTKPGYYILNVDLMRQGEKWTTVAEIPIEVVVE